MWLVMRSLCSHLCFPFGPLCLLCRLYGLFSPFITRPIRHLLICLFDGSILTLSHSFLFSLGLPRSSPSPSLFLCFSYHLLIFTLFFFCTVSPLFTSPLAPLFPSLYFMPFSSSFPPPSPFLLCLSLSFMLDIC